MSKQFHDRVRAVVTYVRLRGWTTEEAAKLIELLPLTNAGFKKLKAYEKAVEYNIKSPTGPTDMPHLRDHIRRQFERSAQHGNDPE